MNGSNASPYWSSNGCSAHSTRSFFNFGYNRSKFSISSSARCARHTRARFTLAGLLPASGTCSVPTPFHTKLSGPNFFTIRFTLNGSCPSCFSSAGNPPAASSRLGLERRLLALGVGSGPNSRRNAPPFFARATTRVVARRRASSRRARAARRRRASRASPRASRAVRRDSRVARVVVCGARRASRRRDVSAARRRDRIATRAARTTPMRAAPTRARAATPARRRASSRATSGRRATTRATTLYGSQGSRSPLVNWYAHEIGLELAMRAPRDETNPHPFGQVPALRDDADADGGELELFESGAILMYLADAYGGLDTPKTRAAAAAWVSWANASLDPVLFVENERGGVVDTKARDPNNKRLRRLDDVLASRDYLLGDFSVADVAVGAYLLYVPQFFPDVSFAPYPALARYMGRLALRDAYAKAFGADVQRYLVQKCVSYVDERLKVKSR